MALQFSIDQPFGIRLYPYFEQVYQIVTGRPANTFVFAPGVTPLSTNNEVLVACVIYLVGIFGTANYMKNFKNPIPLKTVFMLHNVLLTGASLALLLLFIEQLSPIIARHGVFYAVCNDSAWTQPLELLYYLNYLVKYWELADTVFLALKKKKLEFLHYFHHSATMVLCYTQLCGKTSVSWVPITLNLAVHVAMYYYFFRTASGAKIWWKQYLTTMQIIQFVIDLGFIYVCSFYYFGYAHFNISTKCAGEDVAAAFGCGLLTSYLFLFINFYFKTYKAKSKTMSKAKAVSSAGLVTVETKEGSGQAMNGDQKKAKKSKR
ncbi:hypothetical protein INT44_001089 [Umbelopsis vinacea]|uniref:Elongation of fatty acids protein n=1 Tax=Umbelopsis vinacea TaxID=44442 RepID=A0A8H7Q9L2_9FUNG|nr:hypothetical protein INT44_001089 [Umbelopsis vinacea]KAI9289293.1 GNS1/SUR4 family-domain-containing protein [Umbelopsis sp. AD052]